LYYLYKCWFQDFNFEAGSKCCGIFSGGSGQSVSAAAGFFFPMDIFVVMFLGNEKSFNCN
jgi:hypothetical protein